MSYKRRNLYAVVILGCIIPLSFWVAIKPSIALFSDNNRLSHQLSEVQNPKVKLEQLNKALTGIDAQLGYVVEGTSTQQLLLSHVSQFCEQHGLRLNHVSPTLVSKDVAYGIETNVFEISGDFHRLLELIYYIELEKGISKVASAKFEVRNLLNANKRALFLQLYFQNIHAYETD